MKRDVTRRRMSQVVVIPGEQLNLLCTKHHLRLVNALVEETAKGTRKLKKILVPRRNEKGCSGAPPGAAETLIRRMQRGIDKYRIPEYTVQ